MKRVLLLFSFCLFLNFSHAGEEDRPWVEFESYDYITELNAVDIFQGIDQEDLEFVISPNPAKNKLNITLPKGTDEASIEVFDVLGKRVHKGTITQLSSSVNVYNWKSGVYLVKVSDGKTTQTKRFIKQ